MDQHEEFAAFKSLHQKNVLQFLFFGSTASSLLLMIYHGFKNQIKWESILMETVVITLILVCFYLMPILIGFSLYFVILHSYKVLKEEYNFLLSEKEINSVKNFFLLITPYTLFSIFGITFLFALIHFNILQISYGYCLLIAISSITLPHVFVMNKFYRLFGTN